MLVQILEKEIEFLRKKATIKHDLINASKETLGIMFDYISGGRSDLSSIDLSYFMKEILDLTLSSKQVDAILRRHDHDCDGQLTLKEFFRLTYNDDFAEIRTPISLVSNKDRLYTRLRPGQPQTVALETSPLRRRRDLDPQVAERAINPRDLVLSYRNPLPRLEPDYVP